MCKMFVCLFSIILLVNQVHSAPPSLLTKCKADDGKCIKDATNAMIPIFVKGIPEYGVEVLDPIHLKSVNASQGNILFTLSDVTAVGLADCKSTSAKRDPKTSKLYLTLECPSPTLDGQYVLEGNVVVVPVKGSGKVHAQLKSFVVELDLDLEEKTGSDGKQHWHIKSFAHTFHMKEKSIVEFENLNAHNELLRQASSELLLESGNEVISEIGYPVIRLIVSKVVKSVNHFFKAIPIEDLSLD